MSLPVRISQGFPGAQRLSEPKTFLYKKPQFANEPSQTCFQHAKYLVTPTHSHYTYAAEVMWEAFPLLCPVHWQVSAS